MSVHRAEARGDLGAAAKHPLNGDPHTPLSARRAGHSLPAVGMPLGIAIAASQPRVRGSNEPCGPPSTSPQDRPAGGPGLRSHLGPGQRVASQPRQRGRPQPSEVGVNTRLSHLVSSGEEQRVLQPTNLPQHRQLLAQGEISQGDSVGAGSLKHHLRGGSDRIQRASNSRESRGHGPADPRRRRAALPLVGTVPRPPAIPGKWGSTVSAWSSSAAQAQPVA